MDLKQFEAKLPMLYPFEEDKISFKTKLTLTDIPQFICSANMFEDCFPDVKSNQAAYVIGPSKDKWGDIYECLFLYCCEFRITNFFFIWSPTCYCRYILTDFNWKSLLPLPNNFLEILLSEYNVGFSLPLIGKSVRNTLMCYPLDVPYQMFVSPGTGKTPQSESKFLPPFDSDNIPAFDIIRERDLKVFAHSTMRINIASYDYSKYISDLLIYCTAHGIKGAVFHTGIMTGGKIPFEDAKRNMISNIVNGINGAKYRPDQTGTCKFLLETPAGERNEMFPNIYEFISFFLELYNYPGVRGNLEICIDTCHVHQAGYSPYNYLLEVLKYLPVGLIHFNDSCNNWCARKDEHAVPGQGYIPWIYLMKVAQLCKILNIPMVREN